MDINYYIAFDLPVPYRNLLLHPATVKEYLFLSLYSECFRLDKNSIPDAKIIAMTELEYLYSIADKEPHLFWFDRILSISLKDDESFKEIETSMKRYRYDDKRKPFFVIKDDKYVASDFYEIKKIISLQNSIDLIDETISKDVRKSLDEAKEYKKRLSGEKQGSFEDYIVSLSVATGWALDYIYNLPVRKFIKALKRTDNLIHYKIFLAASMSGMVEFKDKSFIKHWLNDLDDGDKYGDVSIDLDTVKNKISLESAKKK